jgi:molybdopterin adenylyltransferase
MITVGILTVSDRSSRGDRDDLSGPEIREIVTRSLGEEVDVVRYEVVPDERFMIQETLREWADEMRVDLILTTGGTGLTPRDVTPEATRAVIEREVPGLTEAMRAASLAKTPHAMLSRAVAGTRRQSLIINLPGSPKAVREALEVVMPAIPHAVDLIQSRDTDRHEVRQRGDA